MKAKRIPKKVIDILEDIVVITTILSIIAGALTILVSSQKILVTCARLICLNNNIQYYNESAIKTDKMTDECESWMEERQSIYDSKDTVIRFYSRQNAIVKILVAFIALVAIPSVVLMIGYYPFIIARNTWKRMERKKRMADRQSQLRNTRR